MDGIHGVTIDLLLREVYSNCNDNWTIRREKISNLLLLEGIQFKHDSALLYQLYIKYIGTEGHGSNIVKKCSRTKNGYKLHRYFCGHYKNKDYLANK